MELMIFIIVGVFTGLSAGLLGVGGGIVSVPAMIFLLPYFDVPPQQIMQIAIATSLALIIPTSIMSAYSHYRRGALVWPYIVRMLPGLLIGAAVGAYIVSGLEQDFLQTIFAVLLMSLALYMLLGKPVTHDSADPHPGFWVFSSTASLIGLLSSLMGVGGGTMTVPFLVSKGLPLSKAIGSSAFCGLPIALSASLTFFVLENGSSASEISSFIYYPAFVGIFIGAMLFTPLGAKLAHELNTVLLKKLFVVFLMLVSIKLLLL